MSETPRIVIVVENSYVPFDARVSNESRAIRNFGWDSVVICPFPPAAHANGNTPDATTTPEVLDGVTVYRFRLKSADAGAIAYLREYVSAFLSIARLSWRIWRDGGFDIIHFANPPDIFFPIAWLYRLLGAQVIFDHHDLFPETVAERFSGWISKPLYIAARVLEYLSFRAANMVITTNQTYRQIALDRGKVAEQRIRVVRNGPIINEFTVVDPVPSLKQGHSYMACYVGVMGPGDGILELLDVIHYLVVEQGRRDILFALIGEGAARPQVLEQVKAWGIEDVVYAPGFVGDRLLLRQIICTSDVCLSPEPYNRLNAHSTFIKIGEYMALGKPVLAFDLKESRYTAQDAAMFVEPGDIVAFGDALVSLLEQPDRREQMGEFGQQRILNELGWEHQEAALRQVYQTLLE